MANQHTDAATHSIISFLQRPQLIYEGSKTQGNRSDVMYGVNIPSGIMNPMVLDKLRGLTSFKATAVIRIQVQSQPFMAGRLLMAAVPTPTLLGERAQWIYNDVMRLMLLNHVQIDISKDSEAELRIPFISPYSCYDLIAKRWDWARVVLTLYSPINTVGSIPLDYVIYSHFEDIELGAPTSGVYGAYATKTLIEESGVVKKPKENTVSRMRASEASSSLSSHLSGISNNVGSIAGSVGSILPFLSPITDTISSVSSGASSVISTLGTLFGFSKPVAQAEAVEIVQRPVVGFSLTDGVDNSHVLALVKQNNVSVVNGLSGTKLDQLSFDFLKKIPQFIDSFNYSDKKGLLWQISVYPALTSKAYFTFKDVSTIRLFQPTHLQYICNPFKYWCGSLVYTFKFVKTDYHSGRVEISFHPFTDFNADNLQVSDYVYRVVVDLREKSEVSVSVPFISQSPYKRLSIPYPMDSKYSNKAFYSTGTLVVRALTGLKSSGVTSNNIECLVEISAGDDFRVACPIESRILPFTPSGLTPNASLYSKSWREESGFSVARQKNPRTEAIISQPPSITNNSSDINNPNVSVEINGEEFTSFRQLLKRNNWTSFSYSVPLIVPVLDFVASPPVVRTQSTLTISYPPDQNKPEENRKSFDVGLPVIEIYRLPTPLSYVSAMFAFHRGGIRVKSYFKDRPSDMAVSYLSYSAHQSDGDAIDSFAPVAFEQPSNKSVGEFQVPYYGLSYMSTNNYDVESFYFSRPRNRILVRSIPDKPVSLAASGADDFDLEVFLGTPPCIFLLHTNATGTASELVDLGSGTMKRFYYQNYPIRYTTSARNADPFGNFLERPTAQVRVDGLSNVRVDKEAFGGSTKLGFSEIVYTHS